MRQCSMAKAPNSKHQPTARGSIVASINEQELYLTSRSSQEGWQNVSDEYWIHKLDMGA